MASGFYCLAGFVAISRYDSINEFLIPSIGYTLVFLPPFLHSFGLWPSPLLYIHPFMAPLLILKGAFQPLPDWQWLYALLYGSAWLGLAFWYCQRSFLRFVVAREGVH
jgi:fluoroquinolone transport system permease protein